MTNIHQYWVYFMTNQHNSVLYIGVTNDLFRRANEHKTHQTKGFTDKYNCEKLVYFEEFNQIEEAIAREKQLKNWKREWKNALVDKANAEWRDLFLDFLGERVILRLRSATKPAMTHTAKRGLRVKPAMTVHTLKS
ncbi:MAG: GIY-YIG nuclease family protein [Prevotellaceae bacterium]|jgi:putative endonuclease|nr:GIY-YIG nuclease family protein [Prevotellaceae bacterium]